MLSGEIVAATLQELIAQNEITQIEVYRFSDSKLHNSSQAWSFGHEYVQVGDQSYNLNRVITYHITDQRLCIYF